MANLPVATVTAQVAAHLRDRILRGEWRDFVPGRDRLAVEVGVSHMTVARAVAQLEEEGLVASRGPGRGKRDTRRAITQAEFVDGGTVGPAPEGR